MVTIKDVANRAKVSTATVSRFINKSGYVGKEAQARIEEAIEILDYYPNEVARSLFNKTSKMIGLLLPDISNPFFPELAKGVEDKVQEAGYSVILGNLYEETERKKNYTNFFQQHNVAGILSASGTIKSGGPVVYLDRVNDQHEYAVFRDNFKGGVLSAKAIAERNPGEIIIISGPQNISVAQSRLDGIISTLEGRGLAYTVLYVKSFGIEEAKKFATGFFSKYPTVNSIVAPNDIYALALLNEATRQNIAVPEDVQIVGYDNIIFNALMNPGLTTVEQSAYLMGYTGAEILLDLIQNKPIKKKRVKITPYLVIRETLREVVK